MSTHKHFDRLCCIILALTLILTLFMMNAEGFGIVSAERVMGYENRLFDNSRVHTIDIVMNDWESFIETCENEEYEACSVIIDGEAFKNIGIRAKGNTSLSSVARYGNDRYSFKLEFDKYESGKSYYGLDKISLNNIIQDNTYMKDFLVYTLMNKLGAASPLCSFVYITVNGEDHGLYLAVEAIEESFLQRNYGSDYGNLYKPDSMDMGGGRGNGKDFDMGAVEDMFGGEMPNFEGMTNKGDIPNTGNMPQPPDMGSFDPSQMKEQIGGGRGGMGGFGMGSSESKLQYIDDDPDSYSTIFDSAKTDISDADKSRLIKSLKTLSEGEDIESVVDIDAVIRYFVVHNFVCNSDSYTGQIIHNYYLYEKDGVLSMLPWDYNLAFGGMNGGNATDTVNTPINSPVSGGIGEDRPMIAWIFQNEEYTSLYERYFAEFMNLCFESGYTEKLISDTAALIAPYVERDPTKFCTYEEFTKGVEALAEFTKLRAESVSAQLDGTIGKTTATQDKSTLVDASHINISDMGSMGMGGGGGFGGEGFDRSNAQGNIQPPSNNSAETAEPNTEDSIPQNQGGNAQNSRPSNNMTRPSGNQQGFEFNRTASASQSNTNAVTLIITAVVLVAGLATVLLFKGREM